MLKLFNSLTRQKEIFRPLSKKIVGLYTCGPTVYNFAHLGNLRTYLFEDILKRVLKDNGYKVKHVMNITDVGHLTSDADLGADKMDEAAKKERKAPRKIADFYTRAFKENLKDLNILPASLWCRATDHIKEQIVLIKKLVQKGFTYTTSQAVYFNVRKFPGYPRFGAQKLEDKKVGARSEVVVDPAKKHPADFALWFKLAGRFKNHLQHWPSAWGEGFPGWHLECSAMSMRYLGQTFDLHAGGVDHLGVHHPNEIAQSEAATGKPLAKYWLHGEFLNIDKEKMAKSEGNFITLEALKKKGFDPLAFRLLVLQTHYRTKMNFSWQSLEAAEANLLRIRGLVRKFLSNEHNISKNKTYLNRVKWYQEQFQKAINDDLNTAQALALLNGLMTEAELAIDKGKPWPSKLLLKTIFEFDQVLGLRLAEVKSRRLTEEEEKLLAARAKARARKDFKLSDQLREKLRKRGIEVRDGKDGRQSWGVR